MSKSKPRSTPETVRWFAEQMATSPGLDEESRKEFYRGHYGHDRKTLELAPELDAVRRAKDYLDDLLKFVNACHDVLRIEIIPEAMEREHIHNINIEGLGRLSLTPDLFVSLKKDMDRDGFFKWLRARKLGDLIQDTINSSTLKAFVARRIKEGKDYPTDYLNVTPYTRASITKG